MKQFKHFIIGGALIAALTLHVACGSKHHEYNSDNDDSRPTKPEVKTFARGADVSWVTELESKGEKFYKSQGNEVELMQMLRDDYDIDAIRLRVWVDPVDGWNGADDVVKKAKRAHDLGLRLMIDFHYSDTWADPGHQAIPKAWEVMTIDQTEQALAAHTKDVLGKLKAAGISPEWVQIGNEVPNGFLYPLAQADKNPSNFARLVTAGNKAVKEVFPDAKTIVHVDRGDNNDLYKWIFDILKENNAQFDMIGMSIYPEPSNWKSSADNLLSNAEFCKKQYGKEVILCEFGMNFREEDSAYSFIKYIIDNSDNKLQGIFYWEPEAPYGQNGGYDKGCFVNGHPTKALEAYRK